MKTNSEKAYDALFKLIEMAERMGKRSLRDIGYCRPAILVHGEECTHIITNDIFTSQKSKDEFAETARLLCQSLGSEATVFVAESWLTHIDSEKGFNTNTPVAENLNRQEVLIIVGETRNGYIQRFLPILRHPDGNFKEFGKVDDIYAGKVEGRFANLLSPDPPTLHMRVEAQQEINRRNRGKQHEAEDRGFEYVQ